MVLIKLLIFTLTFYQLIVDLDAKACPKGHRVKRIRSSQDCEPCPGGYFQPDENESLSCRPCTNCEENWGSAEKEICTPETDRKCACRENFVAWDSNSSTCKCEIGFELRNGACSKCKDKHFSLRINSLCQKWKTCESGEKIHGTDTSDAICNELRINSTSYNTRTQSEHPLEGANTQNMLTTTMTTTTTTTTAPPGHKVPPKTNGKIVPTPNSNPGNHIGTVLILLGIVGLLLLTAVTCKLHNAPCVQRKPGPTNDSSCGRPVEESGDSSQSSSLKLNPGEP